MCFLCATGSTLWHGSFLRSFTTRLLMSVPVSSVRAVSSGSFPSMDYPSQSSERTGGALQRAAYTIFAESFPYMDIPGYLQCTCAVLRVRGSSPHCQFCLPSTNFIRNPHPFMDSVVPTTTASSPCTSGISRSTPYQVYLTLSLNVLFDNCQLRPYDRDSRLSLLIDSKYHQTIRALCRLYKQMRCSFVTCSSFDGVEVEGIIEFCTGSVWPTRWSPALRYVDIRVYQGTIVVTLGAGCGRVGSRQVCC